MLFEISMTCPPVPAAASRVTVIVSVPLVSIWPGDGVKVTFVGGAGVTVIATVEGLLCTQGS